MKILHYLAATGWGGAERMACTIHRLAREHGHESSVEGPALPEVLEGYRQETAESLPCAASEVTWWRSTRGARKRRKALKPDLVHVHLATPSLASVGALIAGRTPTVFTFHLLPQAEPWSRDYLLRVSSQKILSFLLLSKRQRAFVAVSSADRARLGQMFLRETIELAVNAPPFAPLAAKLPASLTWPEATVRLLSVGRLNHQKGFDQLVSALGDPRLRDVNWHWTLIGEGDERARLEALLLASGISNKVTLEGAQAAHAAFAEADLVLCPSRFEGMPLVPLEALLSGTPVVLSRIPAHLELLPGVENAFLPEVPENWPEKLLALLSNGSERTNLQHAQAPFRTHDPRQRLWQDYQGIYERVLATSARKPGVPGA